MKASVKRDSTVRTIEIEVTGAPDHDVTKIWQNRLRVIRPDHVEIRVENGECRFIRVSGPLVLKSGAVSDSVRDAKEWNKLRYSGPMNHIDNAPEWIRLLWTEAVNGVVSWRTPDVTDQAEEYGPGPRGTR